MKTANLNLPLIKEKIIKTDEVLKILYEKKQENEKLSSKYQTLLNKYTKKCNEDALIQEKSKLLETKLKEQQAQYKTLEQQFNDLKIEHNNLEKTHYQYVNESEIKYQSANKDLENYKNECSRLHSQLAVSEGSQQKVKGKQPAKDKCTKQCNNKIADQQKQISKLEELKESKDSLIEFLKKENVNLIKKLETLTKINEKINEQSEHETKYITLVNYIKSKLNITCTENTRDVFELLNNYVQEKNSFEGKIVTLTKDCDRLQKENDCLQNEIVTINKKLEEVKLQTSSVISNTNLLMCSIGVQTEDAGEMKSEDYRFVDTKDEDDFIQSEDDLLSDSVSFIFNDNRVPPIISPLGTLSEVNTDIEDMESIKTPSWNQTGIPEITVTPPTPTSAKDFCNSSSVKVTSTDVEESNSGEFKITPLEFKIEPNEIKKNIKKEKYFRRNRIRKLYEKNLHLQKILNRKIKKIYEMQKSINSISQMPSLYSNVPLICCTKTSFQKNSYKRTKESYCYIVCKSEYCKQYSCYYDNDTENSPNLLGFKEIQSEALSHASGDYIINQQENEDKTDLHNILQKKDLLKNNVLLNSFSQTHTNKIKRRKRKRIEDKLFIKSLQKIIRYVDCKIDSCNRINNFEFEEKQKIDRNIENKASCSHTEPEISKLFKKANKRSPQSYISSSDESIPILKRRRRKRFNTKRHSSNSNTESENEHLDTSVEDNINDKNNVMPEAKVDSSSQSSNLIIPEKQTNSASFFQDTNINQVEDLSTNSSNENSIQSDSTLLQNYLANNSPSEIDSMYETEQTSVDSGYIKSDSDIFENHFSQYSSVNEVERNCLKKKEVQINASTNCRKLRKPSLRSKLQKYQNTALRRIPSPKKTTAKRKQSLKSMPNCDKNEINKKYKVKTETQVEDYKEELPLRKSQRLLNKSEMPKNEITENLEKRKEALEVLKSSVKAHPSDKVETKHSFKRPLCSKKVIPYPRSPSPEALQEYNLLSEPKIIPLEKPERLSVEIAEKQLLKLLNFPNEKRILDEVVDKFANQDEEYIVELVLKQISNDIYDQPDGKHTPPAPLMTSTQRVLLGFMMALEKRNMHVSDLFLEKAEPKLLLEKRILYISPVLRLYLAICKLKHDRERMRRMCCDAVYFMGDLAVPFLFIVFTSWGDVLPMASEATDMPLVTVLIQVIMLKSCNTPGYNLMNLRNILSGYYGYPKERGNNEEIFQNIFNKFKESPSSSLEYAILILCKNCEKQWVADKVKSNIVPYISSNNHPKSNSDMMNLLEKICKRFDNKQDAGILTEITRCIRNLKNDTLGNAIK